MHKILNKANKPTLKKVTKKIAVKKSELEAFSKGNSFRPSDKLFGNEENLKGGKKMLAILMEGKKEAKKELFGLMDKKGNRKTDLKTPFVIIFATDLNGEKELVKRDFLFNFLQGCLAVNVKVMVVDTQQPSDINNLGELPGRNDGHVIWYNPQTDNSGKGREEKEIDRLLLAADMAIVFNNHMDLIKLLMNYGVVVIGDEGSPFLENYKPNEETGNAFLYQKKDLWSVFASMVRALETYKFPYDWNHIVRKIYK